MVRKRLIGASLGAIVHVVNKVSVGEAIPGELHEYGFLILCKMGITYLKNRITDSFSKYCFSMEHI